MDVTTPSKRGGEVNDDRQQEVQIEQAATIVSYLLRRTRAGSIVWSEPADEEMYLAEVDGNEIVMSKTPPYAAMVRDEVGLLSPLFPVRIAVRIQGELGDLNLAISFKVESPPPAFNHLLKMAQSSNNE